MLERISQKKDNELERDRERNRHRFTISKIIKQKIDQGKYGCDNCLMKKERNGHMSESKQNFF